MQSWDPEPLTTALSGALRSRRGRDLTVVVGLGAALVVPQSLNLINTVGRKELERAADVLRWTPPGLAARAATTASSGSAAAGLWWLAAAVVVGVGAAWWWAAGLERSLTTAGSGEGSVAKRRSPSLFSWAWSCLPRNHQGAVAAKDLRYFGRNPRQRAGTLVFLVFAAAAPIAVALGRFGDGRGGVVLLACGFAALGGLSTSNQFAYEVGAHWLNVVAGSDVRADLIGKNLAFAAWTMSVVSVVTIALAAVSGGWVWIPVALVLSLAMFGVSLGVGTVLSVRAPQPMPASQTNLFATNAGQGCSAVLLPLLAVVIQGALWLPLAIMVVPAIVCGGRVWSWPCRPPWPGAMGAGASASGRRPTGSPLAKVSCSTPSACAKPGRGRFPFSCAQAVHSCTRPSRGAVSVWRGGREPGGGVPMQRNPTTASCSCIPRAALTAVS